MKTFTSLLCTLIMSFFASVTHAEEPSLKVSMEVMSEGKVVASPVMVVKNGKRATIQIGNRSVEPAEKKHNVLNIEVMSTLEGDDQLNLAITVKVTNEQIVNGEPVKNTRESSMTVKLSLGKLTMLSFPPPNDSESLALNIKAEVTKAQ